jgi:serine/threonine-protein kinase
MAVSVEIFLKHLASSGILSSDEFNQIEKDVPKENRTQKAAELARELVRQNKLTRFQAQALYEGKARGLVLGNYVLLDRIGTGGMGMVFKAEHRRMKRLVAVKVLHQAAMNDPNIVKRFRREVEAAAKLKHPNIVAAYDADEFNGTHFLVMEFVEGIDLAKLVKEQGPLPVEKALDYILQVARGLEHAHAQGIVHRDIKPGNLLLDKQNVVKILDMGLARFQEATKPALPIDEEAALTGMGSLMGTVDFMSPEQAIDSRQADHLSDLYSLAGTLHFLLTGRPMFDGKTVMARIMAHRESPVPSLRAARKDVPPQVDMIFQRLAAKKKEARYQSATELIRDLANWRGVVEPPNSAGGDNTVPQNVISAIFDD